MDNRSTVIIAAASVAASVVVDDSAAISTVAASVSAVITVVVAAAVLVPEEVWHTNGNGNNPHWVWDAGPCVAVRMAWQWSAAWTAAAAHNASSGI